VASGGSVFLCSLVAGGLIGSFLCAMYCVALRILGERLCAALVVLLVACSAPFVAGSWIVLAGVQVLVPLFLCLGLLTYWHIKDSGWKSKAGYLLLILILFLGPWLREFIGLTAVLVALLDVFERRRPTLITLMCAAGLAHAIFPGWIVHQFIPTAPAKSIFQLGSLGDQVAMNAANGSGDWRESLFGGRTPSAVGHFLTLVPSPIVLLMLVAGVMKGAHSIVIWWQSGRPLRPARIAQETMLVWFVVAWWLGSLLPLSKVFTEEVHLCYALVPFSLLAGVAVEYLVTVSRGSGFLPRSMRAAVLLLVAIGAADQILNLPNSIRIVTGINDGMAQVADKLRETVPAGAVVVGNALHLEDIRLACNGHFRSFWTVTAGIPHPSTRAFMTKESLVEFMSKRPATDVYFLDADYDFLPTKRSYHSHRFVKNRDFELQKLWSMSPIDIRYPFLDPVKNITPREFTNVLFSPDLENDFYRGRAVNHARFVREIYVNYTLYKVVGTNPKRTVMCLTGDSDAPQ